MSLKFSVRYLLCFLLGFNFLIEAQVTFEAKVSKRRLGLNERLRIDFEMNENGDNFNPPSFSNFQVVSGPQQAVSRSWVNGVQSFSKIYTYFLTPKIKGKVTIGQAVVTIGGEIYKTTPVEIEVTNSVKNPNDPNNVDNIVDGNIHLVAEVSKSAPYLNEGITVIYKLYFRNPISVSDVSELESPSYGDFWSHLIKIGRAEINMRGSYKGEPYNEVIWRKAVLYPQKTGKLVLEPLTLNLSLSIPSNRRDLFGRRIMTQTQKTITTGEKVIAVKDLPQNNKPENFSGAVGQFDLDVILNKDLLKASESFQAKIKVKGKGNLKLFNLPNINVPNTLEVYEPEHDEKVKITISGILAFALGILGAFKFSNLTSKFFGNLVDWNQKTIQLVCFIALFLIIVYLTSLMAKMITKTLQLIALGWLNRIFGGLFGFIKWSIIISALIMVVNEINTLITVFPNSIFENSKIYPFLANVGSFLFDWATESKVLEGNQIV